jgi:hypothetical protein
LYINELPKTLFFAAKLLTQPVWLDMTVLMGLAAGLAR